jgi:uncharacterized protein YegL
MSVGDVRTTDHGRFGMFQHLSHVRHSLGSAVVKATAAVAEARRTMMGDQTGRYRPEVHYMRGPGP